MGSVEPDKQRKHTCRERANNVRRGRTAQIPCGPDGRAFWRARPTRIRRQLELTLMPTARAATALRALGVVAPRDGAAFSHARPALLPWTHFAAPPIGMLPVKQTRTTFDRLTSCVRSSGMISYLRALAPR